MSDTPTPTTAAGGDRQDRGPRRDSRGGPGGAGAREGGRKFFRRKKVCKFCVEKIDAINYKDVRLLSGFVAERGKIVPRPVRAPPFWSGRCPDSYACPNRSSAPCRMKAAAC